jgi:multiple antibiotic resistance protein
MQFAVWLLPAFVMLFVTIGPIDLAAIFSAMTAGMDKKQRRRTALRGVLIAGAMLLIFAVAGKGLLWVLNVSMPAFQVAGGILLFLQALSLTFSSPGLSSINEGEKAEAERGDIAVFPLAFPLISGPGSFSAVVLLMGRADTWIDRGLVLAIVVVILAITYVMLRLSDQIMKLLGRTGSDVVGRIAGVLLAALAVQFVFDGLRGAGIFG